MTNIYKLMVDWNTEESVLWPQQNAKNRRRPNSMPSYRTSTIAAAGVAWSLNTMRDDTDRDLVHYLLTLWWWCSRLSQTLFWNCWPAARPLISVWVSPGYWGLFLLLYTTEFRGTPPGIRPAFANGICEGLMNGVPCGLEIRKNPFLSELEL